MKCEICEMDAPFFTEIYDPNTDKHSTIYLCRRHHLCLLSSIDKAMDDLRDFQRQEKMSIKYIRHHAGSDCCKVCMHARSNPADGLYCGIFRNKVYKDDTCKLFMKCAASQVPDVDEEDEPIDPKSEPVGLKMKYDYTHHNAGGTRCLDCEFISCGEDKVCHCDLLDCRVYKGDICKGFKRRGWHINEGTPDEKILERIKETMDDNKPMPLITPVITPIDERLKDVAKVLDWLYCRDIHMHGTDEEIEAAIRRIGGAE